MRANKPGVPWTVIEDRYKAGESANVIAKDFSISRQAIEKKAKLRSWRPKTEFKPPAVREDLRRMLTRDWKPSPMWLRFVAATETARRLKMPEDDIDQRLVAEGKCTRENLARILTLVGEGKTKSVASKLVGVSPASLTEWLRRDSGLVEIFDMAQAFVDAGHMTTVQKASEEGDPGTARWNLQHAPSTRDDYRKSGDRGPHGGDNYINVTMNLRPPKPPEVVDGDFVTVDEDDTNHQTTFRVPVR